MSKDLLRCAHPNHDRYARSKRHELRIAAEIGGRRLPNSGGARRSRWDPVRSQSGDIEHRLFLIEHKRSETGKISVKKAWLETLADGAMRLGKIPVLVLTFEKRGGAPTDVALLRKADVERLTLGAWQLKKGAH